MATSSHLNETFIRMAIDLGTTSSSVAYQICTTPEQTSHSSQHLSPILMVHFGPDNKEIETPMIVAYEQNGHLLEGFDLLQQLNAKVLDESNILRFAKLALHDDPETWEIKDKVEKYTAKLGKKPEDLITDYLQVIVRKALGTIRQTLVNTTDMQLELFLSTPQIWSPKSNKALVKAGEKLAKRCFVVSEPLCAAAFIIYDELSKLDPRLELKFEVNDLVLVADLGGGTADLVLFRLCGLPSDGPDFQLEVLRPATGSLAGSSQINRNFISYMKNIQFKNDMRALSLEASSLGYSVLEFLARASTAFEGEKSKFPGFSFYSIIVLGRQGATKQHWVAVLDEEIMQSFFEPVVQDIEALIRDTLKGIDNVRRPRKLKAMILCGGLGSSAFVRERVNHVFEGVKVLEPMDQYKAPVAKGALLRYSMPFQKPLGARDWSLCCIRAEEFDPDVHPDGLMDARSTQEATTWTRPSTQQDPDVVKEDPVSGYDIVEDRCIYILNGKTGETNAKWSEHYEECTDDSTPLVLNAEVFWTNKADPTDHEPLYVRGTHTLRSCFQKFDDVEVTIKNPHSRGFPIVRKGKGSERKAYWKILTCVIIVRTLEEIKLSLSIRDPEEEVLWDDDGNDTIAPPLRKGKDKFKGIYNSSFSHVDQEVDTFSANSSQAQTQKQSNKTTKASTGISGTRPKRKSVWEVEDSDEEYTEPGTSRGTATRRVRREFSVRRRLPSEELL